MLVAKILKGGGFKKMFMKLIKGTAAGIAAHQTNILVEQWEERIPAAWTRNARYTIGMLVALPVGSSIFKSLYRHGMEEEAATAAYEAAFISAAVSVGVGVAVGYVIDSFVRIVWGKVE